MIIFPAIDIKNGQCVRLTKGDFDTTEKVADDPVSTAMAFKSAGASWLHMVDLDGALQGEIINNDTILDVVKKTGLKVQVGGGIRTIKSISYYVEHDVARIILGSIAISDPLMVKEAVREFGEKIAVGIDARNEIVSGSGWTMDSDIHYLEMAARMENAGVRTIIFTDISRDGTLKGPNLQQLAAIDKKVECNIIASGGIKTLEDILAIKDMGIYGVICGKSLYKGTLSLAEAINCCGD
ncbi:MAG: 1-(5-phosphoribosyl)-5-[(5-phosphoribosylamino)methylideneamino]imidazole-4-carboxamide isomerase [Anaerovoracaceae bacterium]|jgi:phosphoribosylformimino-5-aminoimidazole carboxamide ribotide isomerase